MKGPTDAQIIAAIGAAIRDRDFEVVSGLIALLAIQNPTEAAFLLDSIRGALRLLSDGRDALR